MILPPLLTNNAALPARTQQNQAAGIEKRLMAVVPLVHPALLPAPLTRSEMIRRMLPRHFVAVRNHPILDIPEEYLRPLNEMSSEWTKELLRVATQLKVQDPTLPWGHHLTASSFKDSTPIIKLVETSFTSRAAASTQITLPGPSASESLTEFNLVSQDSKLLKTVPTSNLPKPSVQTGETLSTDPTINVKTLDASVKEFLTLPENQWLVPTNPIPFKEWVSRFKDHRQEELTLAQSEVTGEGILKKDSLLKSFIKVETSTTATDPRNISPRSDKFLSILGPYVAAIEKLAKQCPYLVKGLTPQERGPLMAESWRGAIVETDFSRFDMTVSRDMIVHVERALFRAAFPEGLHPELDLILPMLETMTGFTDLGVSYSVDGTRASGDAHTSIANGFLNRFIIWSCLQKQDPKTWSSFHEGDDGFINCDVDAVDDVVANLNFAQFLGFKLKVVVPPIPEVANFCGRSICSGCHREFCDLPRSFSKFHITVKQGDLRCLALAKAYSYLSTDPHTPMVSVLCQALINHLQPLLSSGKQRKVNKQFRRYEIAKIIAGKKTRSLPILPCCRAAVSLQTGWSPSLQVAFENQVSQWANGVTYIDPIAVDDYQVDGEGAVFY